MLTILLSICFTVQELPAPGKLVDIGGYKLHAQVMGSGSPTVVFLAGSGDWSSLWAPVQRPIAQKTRTLSYDYQGSGWSEFGPPDRGLRQDADEFCRLLKALGVKGPFILVGHSLGGLIAQTFALAHPDEVQAIVFIDASTPDLRLKFKEGDQFVWRHYRDRKKDAPLPPIQEKLAEPPKLRTVNMKRDPGDISMFPKDVQQQIKAIYARPMTFARQRDWVPNELAMMHASPEKYSLGSLPIIIISGQDPNRYAGDEHRGERLKWRAQATRYLLGLSTDSRFIPANQSGHHVHLDEPDLVIRAILDLLL